MASDLMSYISLITLDAAVYEHTTRIGKIILENDKKSIVFVENDSLIMWAAI